MMKQPERPLPHPTWVTEPYWKAAQEHTLALPRCRSCGEVHFFPRHICPSCLSEELRWEKVSGKGTIYSYTVIRQPANPFFTPDAPYVFAIIELDEGPHLVSNMVDCRIEDVSIGAAVEAVYDNVTPEVTLPRFRLSSATHSRE